jgi:hypothetical protein
VRASAIARDEAARMLQADVNAALQHSAIVS